MKRLWMLCAVLTFGLIPQVIFAAEAKPPNQALQQTAGHESFLGLQAHRCPAAAELSRSAAESLGGSRPARTGVRSRYRVIARHRFGER